MKGAPCMGCGAVLPAIEGPTHRYMESSPACWAAYSEVLAREFSDQDLFQRTHRCTVDAYAVQHPGHPSPQSIQSVAVHLMSLCTLIEGGSSAGWATQMIREAVRIKGRFVWLPPPPSMGPVTVADVRGAEGAAGHEKAVLAWARSAWDAWSPHHATIRSWCDMTKAPGNRQAPPAAGAPARDVSLFSYGTLQLEQVQLETFGRRLDGRADEMPGFEEALVRIEDPEVVRKSGKTHHPIVRFTGRDADTVKGVVFQVTAGELEHADKYEVAAYRRVAVDLRSGIRAWVYVDARHCPPGG